MATKPLDKVLSEKIVADWRTGAYSQQKLANKYKVSKGSVNKLCKETEQDVTAIVTAGTQYKSGLAQHEANHDDRIVTAIKDAVHERTKHIQFFDNASLLLAGTVVKKIRADGVNATYQDANAAANTLSKCRTDMLGKAPDVVINNTNTQQTAVIAKLSQDEVDKLHRAMDAIY